MQRLNHIPFIRPNKALCPSYVVGIINSMKHCSRKHKYATQKNNIVQYTEKVQTQFNEYSLYENSTCNVHSTMIASTHNANNIKESIKLISKAVFFCTKQLRLKVKVTLISISSYYFPIFSRIYQSQKAFVTDAANCFYITNWYKSVKVGSP
jgi:hypothetical protein